MQDGVHSAVGNRNDQGTPTAQRIVCPCSGRRAGGSISATLMRRVQQNAASRCFHTAHAPPCERCKQTIDGAYAEVQGKRYCKMGCFCCYECHVPFTREDKQGAYPIGGRLLCYAHAKDAKKRELAAKRWDSLKRESLSPEGKRKVSAARLAAAVFPPVVEETIDEDDEAWRRGSETSADSLLGTCTAPLAVEPRADNRQSFARAGTRKVVSMPRASRALSHVFTQEEQRAVDAAIGEAKRKFECGLPDEDEDEDSDEDWDGDGTLRFPGDEGEGQDAGAFGCSEAGTERSRLQEYRNSCAGTTSPPPLAGATGHTNYLDDAAIKAAALAPRYALVLRRHAAPPCWQTYVSTRHGAVCCGFAVSVHGSTGPQPI